MSTSVLSPSLLPESPLLSEPFPLTSPPPRIVDAVSISATRGIGLEVSTREGLSAFLGYGELPTLLGIVEKEGKERGGADVLQAEARGVMAFASEYSHDSWPWASHPSRKFSTFSLSSSASSQSLASPTSSTFNASHSLSSSTPSRRLSRPHPQTSSTKPRTSPNAFPPRRLSPPPPPTYGRGPSPPPSTLHPPSVPRASLTFLPPVSASSSSSPFSAYPYPAYPAPPPPPRALTSTLTSFSPPPAGSARRGSLDALVQAAAIMEVTEFGGDWGDHAGGGGGPRRRRSLPEEGSRRPVVYAGDHYALIVEDDAGQEDESEKERMDIDEEYHPGGDGGRYRVGVAGAQGKLVGQTSGIGGRTRRPPLRAPVHDDGGRKTSTQGEGVLADEPLDLFWCTKRGMFLNPSTSSLHPNSIIPPDSGVERIRFDAGEWYRAFDEDGRGGLFPWLHTTGRNTWFRAQVRHTNHGKCPCGFTFVRLTTERNSNGKEEEREVSKRPSVSRQHVAQCARRGRGNPFRRACMLTRDFEAKQRDHKDGKVG